MKTVISIAALALCVAVPAVAQDASGQNAAPAPAPAPAPSATPAAPRFTLDTPIQQIVDNPAARAVLDTAMPGVSTHPSYEMFKGMSLREVQPYSNGVITDAMMTATAEGLARIQ